MNGLYPIIRRVRRPLIVADAPPPAVGNIAPVVPATAAVVPASPIVEPVAAPEAPILSDANVTSKRKGR